MQILADAGPRAHAADSNTQLALFASRAPRRPYATDTLSAGLRVMPAIAALERRYIQYNPPAFINWLAFDVDRPFSLDAEWAVVAPPNIICRNPGNGHAHLLFGIAAPVCTTSAARIAPLRLLAAINESYRHALDADIGFAELICKNPLHPHWQVETPRMALYDLAELAEYVDLAESDKRVRATPKRAQVGLGRNCNLFNSLRTWCYRWLAEYRPAGFNQWQAAVLVKAGKLNTFADPLPASEIKAIARSVAKWTWSHYTGRQTASSLAADGLTPETFSLLQSNLGKRGMAKRWGDNSEKRAEAVRLKSAGMRQGDIASQLDVSQQTVSRWLKQPKG